MKKEDREWLSEVMKDLVSNHVTSAPETVNALKSISEIVAANSKRIDRNTTWRNLITGALIFMNILLVPMVLIFASKIIDNFLK